MAGTYRRDFTTTLSSGRVQLSATSAKGNYMVLPQSFVGFKYQRLLHIKEMHGYKEQEFAVKSNYHCQKNNFFDMHAYILHYKLAQLSVNVLHLLKMLLS